jgi:hypothetical protein
MSVANGYATERNYTMRTHTMIYGLIATGILIAGCASAPQPGTLLTHETACAEANNGQRVAIEGYPQLSSMTLVDDDFSVDLFEQPGGSGEKISVYFTVGTGANQAENLPEDYTDADLKIHTSDNQVVSVDRHIRVHGTLFWSESSPGEVVCFISPVDLIEVVA